VHFAFGNSLDRDESVGGARLGEAAADEKSAECYSKR
jgi:hypothetical protein